MPSLDEMVWLALAAWPIWAPGLGILVASRFFGAADQYEDPPC